MQQHPWCQCEECCEATMADRGILRNACFLRWVEVSNPQQFQFGAQVPTGCALSLCCRSTFRRHLVLVPTGANWCQAASVLDPESCIFPKFNAERWKDVGM